MTQQTPSSATGTASPAGLILAASLAAGLALALLTLVLLHAFSGFEEKRLDKEANLTGLRLVTANIDSLWDRTALFAEQAGQQINNAGQKNLADLLAQQRALWPQADLSLYDQNGEYMPLGADAPERPSGRSVRAVVHKALVGQSAKDITRSGPFISLSASFPLHLGKARALVVTLPLDERALVTLKERSAAHVALLPVDDSGKARSSDLASAVNTFAPAGGRAAEIWDQIRQTPPPAPGHTPVAVELAGGAVVSALLLEDVLGVPAGLLITCSESPATFSSWPQNFAAACVAGILGAVLCRLCLGRYARRMGESFAGAAVCLAERNRDCGENTLEDWPPALREALTRIAQVLREYRKRVRTAEVERDAAGRRLTADQGHSREALEDDDYLRLFDNAPVGVFRAESGGAFLRVNQAFALMLGYDTATMLLSENVSFTDLCLYGDEIRNPVNMLLEQGGGRQIISLRKRDGKIGDYTLICVPVTSPSGDLSPAAEGFLLDRLLEDQLTRAERERELADRQRTSLALLLAATSLQTSNTLALPQGPGQRKDDAAHDAPPPPESPGEDAPECPAGMERRKSVLSVQDIMSDIYKIALTEVTASQPVDVPIEFGRFLRRLCRQAAPQLQARGISLSCEVAADLPARFNGPAPMLRHTLQRALLALAGTARGGWANLSARRDPNSPRSVGLSRVLFSVSWGSFRHGGDNRHLLPDSRLFSGREEFVSIFDQQAPDVDEADIPEQTALRISDEQEVIRYLSQRMQGEMIEGAMSVTLKSMQITVPLAHAGDFAELEGGSMGAERLAGPAFAEETALTAGDEEPAHEESEALAEISVAAAANEDAAPLSILVEELADNEFETPREDKGPGLDILLVDDSLNNRLLFSLYLRDAPHRITEAHDGQEGVEAFKRGRFDVIFMDMEMPLMDGYQATRIIRALEADSGREATPIVGMTSYALPEFRRQCILSGCTDFLSKPFSKIALYAVLDAFSQFKQDEEEADGNGQA